MESHISCHLAGPFPFKLLNPTCWGALQGFICTPTSYLTLTLSLERPATNVLSCWHLLNMQQLNAFVNSVDTLAHLDSITGVCDLLVLTLWHFAQRGP